MKRIITVLTIVVLGIAAQACGSSEKCPAYSKAPVTEAGDRV